MHLFHVGLGFDIVQNLVDVLFETKLEHLISFIEHQGFEVLEVNISSFNVIENSSGGSDKDIDTVSELSDLFFDVDSAVHRHDLELVVVMLQLFDLSGYLNCELSSWG